jgi:hydroxymethylbilane synthase/uroporphyrinogen III methyltransferase/synthase
MSNIKVGTRGSQLALAQTGLVIEKLKKAYPEDSFEAVVIQTTGDRHLDVSLDAIGTKGVFVDAIEEALFNGDIRLAVHSMKDMPDETAQGLVFAKTWEREDARDALVLREAKSLDELPPRAVIATGSKRRAFSLHRLRPDLEIVPIRGNIDTRIRKMHEQRLDGIVLAAAGLKRLGRESEIAQYFSVEEMIPAPAQGVLAIELRADDAKLLEMVNALADEQADREVRAERGFLKGIGGDCHLPIGAYADTAADGTLTLRALFGNEDGSSVKTVRLSGDSPEELAKEAVREILQERRQSGRE